MCESNPETECILESILKTLNDINIESPYIRSLRGQYSSSWCISVVCGAEQDEVWVKQKIKSYQLWGNQWIIKIHSSSVVLVFSYTKEEIDCMPTQQLEKHLMRLQLLEKDKVHDVIFVQEEKDDDLVQDFVKYNVCDIMFRNTLQLFFENPYRQDLSEFELEQKIKYDIADLGMSNNYKIRSSELLSYMREKQDDWKEMVSTYGANLLPLATLCGLYKHEYSRCCEYHQEFDFIFRSSLVFKQLVSKMKNIISDSYEDPPFHLVEILEKYKKHFDELKDDDAKEKYLEELDSCDQYISAKEEMTTWHNTRVSHFHQMYRANYIVPYNV